MEDRRLLETWYHEALRASDPQSATREAVAALALASPPLLLAIGKGAASMARGALEALTLAPCAGLIVSETGSPDRIGGLRHIRGDHPVPGAASQQAADAIGELVASQRGVADALVLVSGGTTSLIAAPVEGLATTELRSTFEVLLASGVGIDVMNGVRRRLLRWGGGRLAAALAPARVYCLVVSDVMSGDLAAIGSGPCVPMGRPVEVPATLAARLPAAAWGALFAPVPAPPQPAIARIILDNRTPIAAIRGALRSSRIHEEAAPFRVLDGEAREAGRHLGRHLVSLGNGAFVVGGETTVTLSPGAGPGGRCQELALATAREIRGLPLTLLAAGTDGRDGPTDAAGAIVDGKTWDAIIAAGRDPEADLLAHRSHAALGAAGALIPACPSGTNVNDVVIGLARSRTMGT
jgi:hydroxypyruvate reductase